MTKQENPNFKASRFAPNPQEVAYWIDLTADPNGGVIKTYDGTEWYPINQSEVNIPVVSEDANGLMSSDMLVKLNGIEDNANNYILPAATLNAIGGVKKAAMVGAVSTSAELADVITSLNAVLTSLKSAGIMDPGAN